MTLTFQQFCDLHPRMVRQLVFWRSKQAFQLPEWNDLPASIKNRMLQTEIQPYINDLILNPSSDLRVQQIRREGWSKQLSHKEIVTLSSFLPKLDLGQDKVDTGWYGFAAPGEYLVLEEPVLDLFSYKGRETGIVTRNQYNSAVLNAPNLMIVDVDLIGDSTSMFDPVIVRHQDQALAALRAWVELNPGYGFSVYRTAAGLRYLCTTHEVDPKAHSTRMIMKALYADPRYMNLCQVQETFRARLDPKPWRCGDFFWRSGKDWHAEEPITDDDGVRVCERIGTIGSNKVLPQFKSLVEHHDKATRCDLKGMLV